MKRTVKIFAVAVVALIGFATVSYAQPRAIGVNLGYGASLSYQHGLGDANMIDLAVEVPGFSGIGATCTYDWIDPFNAPVPWNEKGEWHWYMGVGAGAGMAGWNGAAGYAGVVGHFGIEYDFWFPLQLSLDWRPNVGVGFAKNAVAFNLGGLVYGIQLGVRYRF